MDIPTHARTAHNGRKGWKRTSAESSVMFADDPIGRGIDMNRIFLLLHFYVVVFCCCCCLLFVFLLLLYFARGGGGRWGMAWLDGRLVGLNNAFLLAYFCCLSGVSIVFFQLMKQSLPS